MITISEEKQTSGNNHVNKTDRFLIVLLIVLLVFLLYVAFNFFVKGGETGTNGTNVSTDSGLGAKGGDVVEVRYTGSLDSGEIFDTNVKEVAEENNLTKAAYPLLKFTLGSGMVIKGFDEGVKGMKVGEEKTIEIPPEEAYGVYKAELVETLPDENEIYMDKYYEISKSLLDEDLKEGDIIDLEDVLWGSEVINITGDIVTVTPAVKPGEVYDLSINANQVRIDEVNEDNIKVVQIVKLEKDALVRTDKGFGKVIAVGTGFYKIDFNHELAGKKLIFDIKMVSINGEQ